MPLFLLKIGKWIVGKGLVYALAAAVVVAVFALWLFAEKSLSSEDSRVGELDELERRAGEIYAELDNVHVQLVELGERVDETRKRIENANQVINYLDGLLKRIGRFITLSEEERKESERQLAEAKAEKAAETATLDRLVVEQSRLRLDRAGLTEEAVSLEQRIEAARAKAAGFPEHLRTSWESLKPYILVAVAGALFLPIAWKLFAYYVLAPLFALAGPIRFARDQLASPSLGHTGVSARVTVEKGQRLWVKESYLQASDESLVRKTRFLLDWSIPCTCLAAGLVEMIELVGDEGNGKVTVSPQKRAELEVAVVEVPEGGQMIARPSSIAGLVSRDGKPLKIRRRWRLLHPQAWLTFQFRYFVFEGPCALIVTGIRGVRFEELDTEGHRGRRSNQVATIGFTPDLAYSVVRAETFWSYFRGFNPLFDDVFRGKGAFLCQEISVEEQTGASRFWAGFWSGMLKVLGV